MKKRYEFTDQVAIVYDHGALRAEDAKKYGWKIRTDDCGFSLPFVDYSPDAKDHPLAALGHEVHRIRALCDIPDHGVKTGDLGGFIETETNLLQLSNSWVADESVVFGSRAKVAGNAVVCDHAIIAGTAGDTRISGCAIVSDESVVIRGIIVGNVRLCGNTVCDGRRTHIDGNFCIVNAKISSHIQ